MMHIIAAAALLVAPTTATSEPVSTCRDWRLAATFLPIAVEGAARRANPISRDRFPEQRRRSLYRATEAWGGRQAAVGDECHAQDDGQGRADRRQSGDAPVRCMHGGRNARQGRRPGCGNATFWSNRFSAMPVENMAGRGRLAVARQGRREGQGPHHLPAMSDERDYILPPELIAKAREVVVANRAAGCGWSWRRAVQQGWWRRRSPRLPALPTCSRPGSSLLRRGQDRPAQGQQDVLDTFGAVSIAWPGRGPGGFGADAGRHVGRDHRHCGTGGRQRQEAGGHRRFARARRGADPDEVVADVKPFGDLGRGGPSGFQAALCALELLMPVGTCPVKGVARSSKAPIMRRSADRTYDPRGFRRFASGNAKSDAEVDVRAAFPVRAKFPVVTRYLSGPSYNRS